MIQTIWPHCPKPDSRSKREFRKTVICPKTVCASIAKAYVFDRTNTCERVTKTITVTDAGFDNLFHGGFCDIRFYTDGSPLYVSEVTLIK